jgi:hypothetical protein
MTKQLCCNACGFLVPYDFIGAALMEGHLKEAKHVQQGNSEEAQGGGPTSVED